MALIVGTDTYVTEDELTAYATKRGITILLDRSVILTKALDYIETRSYVGVKTETTQVLQWPREVCTGILYCAIDNTVVPTAIKQAQMIAALIIDGGNEVQPTVDRAVKSERVDVLEVTYMDNAVATIQHTKLQDILRPYVTHTVRAVRV